MPRRVEVLIDDALKCIGNIRRFTAGRSLEDYLEDDLVQAAVERQLEIIGEALKRIRESDPTTAASITDLHAIIGLRNILVHTYEMVELDFLWQIVEKDIPELEEVLMAVRRGLP